MDPVSCTGLKGLAITPGKSLPLTGENEALPHLLRPGMHRNALIAGPDLHRALKDGNCDLTQLNMLGGEGDYTKFGARHQAVRNAEGPNAPFPLQEAAELRFDYVLGAARVFSGLRMSIESIQ